MDYRCLPVVLNFEAMKIIQAFSWKSCCDYNYTVLKIIKTHNGK